MARPAKLAHIVFMTRRFDEMVAWYRNVFEADVVHQDPALAFLAYDDEHHRFAFANLALLAAHRAGASEQQLLSIPDSEPTPLPLAHGVSA